MSRTGSQLVLALGLMLTAAALAAAKGHAGHAGQADQCGFHTPYDVRVTAAGVAFQREGGKPAQVVMHEGQLRVDGRAATVSTADAARLRRYEQSMRTLLPEVAGIAREGLEIGFAALTEVTTAFAQHDDDRQRLLDRLGRSRARAMARLDAGLGSGIWRQHDLQDGIEDSLGDAVGELVSSVTADAVKAALSGDEGRIEALQARADALEQHIDRAVDARADRLADRAEALCPRLGELVTLQDALDYRLPGGAPLQLIEAPAAAASDAVVLR